MAQNCSERVCPQSSVTSEVVFLHQGRVEESGCPKEVLANPRSERLQQFLAGSLK